MNIEKYLEKIDKEGVYVFGAGRVASVIYTLLKESDVEIEAFIVSDTNNNKRKLMGKEVIGADSARVDKAKQVLIGVLEYGQKTIYSYLVGLGYSRILNVPDGILELEEWENKRINAPVIEVTAKIGCGVGCKYCPQKKLIGRYYEKNKKRQGQMTFEEYKYYLNKCPEDTIVDFSGFVEPFLIEDSIDMMEYTYKSGHEMTLFTTLHGLTKEHAKRVIEMPFRYVCWHTPDEDGYANIPMTKEYFSVLELFLNAKKNDGKPFVDAANCQSNPHPDVLKLTRGKLKIYCEMSDRAGNIDEDDNRLTRASKKGEIYCSRSYSLNHNVLLPDGSLVLCCNDFGLESVLGNLKNNSYEEIMNGNVLRRIKRGMHININEDIICRKCMFAKEKEFNYSK